MEKSSGKPRLRLNVVDIVIIAAIVVAAAAFLYVWRASGKSSAPAANLRPVHYKIELSGMVDGAAEKIKAGDTIIDGAKKFVMGTVVSVEVAPTTVLSPNLNTGDVVLSEVPGQQTAIVELVCDCSATDSQITAESGYVIRVGNEVTASGPGYAGKGYVIAIEREDS